MGSRIRTAIAAAVPNAWRTQHSSAHSNPTTVNQGPTNLNNSTDTSRPVSFPGQLDLASSSHFQGSQPSSSRGTSSSPTRLRHDSFLHRVPEEEGATPAPAEGDDEPVDEDDGDEVEWELEEMGLYRGSYPRLIRLFSIVPLSSLLVLILLAVLPPLMWPLPPGTYFPSHHNFPFPLPELLTSISLWTLSYALHVPLHSLFSFLTPISSHVAVITLLTTTMHVLVTNLLRLSSLALLRIRHEMDYPMPTCLDNSFLRVVWIAIGWSIAEVGVSVVQGYGTLALYKGVIVPPGREKEFLRWKDESNGVRTDNYPSGSPGPMASSGYFEDAGEAHRPYSAITPERVATSELNTSEGDAELAAESRRRYIYRTASAAAIRLQLEQDLDQLIALKAREEVEDVYGMPAIKIPVFISTLQRLNSIVLSQGLNLLLSAAYLSSPISLPVPQNSAATTLPTNRPFIITFPVAVVIHLLLSILHTPLVLPRIGLHTASYVGLIVGLGCLFAGLGLWKALYAWVWDIGG